ncbi:NAD-binding protein [Meredithblackwellia eburnea MCA 4105]
MQPQLHTEPYGSIIPAKLRGELKGQVAFITGAGRGIGKAIALAFAEAGASVALVSRTRSELESVARQCERFDVRSLVLAGDLLQDDFVLESFAQAESSLGPVDVCVVNAGVAVTRPFWLTPIGDTWRLFELNVKSPLVLIQTAIQSMISRHKGVVIVTASRAGTVDPPALIRAVSCLQEEMNLKGEKDIHLYSCHPGAVKTSMAVDQVHPDFDKVKPGFVSQLNSVFDRFCDAPELCAWTYVALAAGRATCLRGRYFDVEQDLDVIAAHSEEILNSDLYKLGVSFLGGLPNDGGNVRF